MKNFPLKIPPIVGFCGYARIGKNTCADRLTYYLMKYYNVYSKHLAFAETLKKDCRGLYDIFLENWEKSHDGLPDKFDENKKKECFRPIWVLWSKILKEATKCETIWVERLRWVLENCVKMNVVALVTDVRYDYEIDAITKMGGIVVRIDSPKFKPMNEEELYSFGKIDMEYKRTNPMESKYVTMPRVELENQINEIVIAVNKCGFNI